jgi:predicted regulator of Ras-like GTPase activity (Roadblock/LC7/MglB family)
MDLESLKKEMNLVGIAIVRRDGTIGDSLLSEQLNKDTFSIMCATIYGAAITANNELKYKNLKKIVIDTESGSLVIVPFKDRHFIISIVPQNSNIDHVIENINSKIQ